MNRLCSKIFFTYCFLVTIRLSDCLYATQQDPFAIPLEENALSEEQSWSNATIANLLSQLYAIDQTQPSKEIEDSQYKAIRIAITTAYSQHILELVERIMFISHLDKLLEIELLNINRSQSPDLTMRILGKVNRLAQRARIKLVSFLSTKEKIELWIKEHRQFFPSKSTVAGVTLTTVALALLAYHYKKENNREGQLSMLGGIPSIFEVQINKQSKPSEPNRLTNSTGSSAPPAVFKQEEVIFPPDKVITDYTITPDQQASVDSIIKRYSIPSPFDNSIYPNGVDVNTLPTSGSKKPITSSLRNVKRKIDYSVKKTNDEDAIILAEREKDTFTLGDFFGVQVPTLSQKLEAHNSTNYCGYYAMYAAEKLVQLSEQEDFDALFTEDTLNVETMSKKLHALGLNNREAFTTFFQEALTSVREERMAHFQDALQCLDTTKKEILQKKKKYQAARDKTLHGEKLNKTTDIIVQGQVKAIVEKLDKEKEQVVEIGEITATEMLVFLAQKNLFGKVSIGLGYNEQILHEHWRFNLTALIQEFMYENKEKKDTKPRVFIAGTAGSISHYIATMILKRNNKTFCILADSLQQDRTHLFQENLCPDLQEVVPATPPVVPAKQANKTQLSKQPKKT